MDLSKLSDAALDVLTARTRATALQRIVELRRIDPEEAAIMERELLIIEAEYGVPPGFGEA